MVGTLVPGLSDTEKAAYLAKIDAMPDDPPETLAGFVRARRIELGLSLQRLADRAQCSKGHLHEIEKGLSKNLTISAICSLSAGLQVDAITLFCIAADLTPPRVR